MNKTLLLLPLLATACSFPSFVASKTVELELPVDAATRLHCETHNGDIAVTTGTSSDTVLVRATIKVHGHTQAEADNALLRMSLRHEVDGDTLRVVRDYPARDLDGLSPSYDFTLLVPARFALVLRTHNGDVATSGTRGALKARSHNGDIETQVASDDVELGTHNGDIRLAIVDALQPTARVETHNGEVRIVVPEGASCALEAHTHNGVIALPAGVRDAEVGRHDATGRIGPDGGDARIYVKTHNGNVQIR